MEEYQEFLNKLQKRGSKPHKIGHCLGSRDAWKWVRKNKWKALKDKPCEQSLYGQVINTVNQYLIERLLEGHRLEFPYKMGTLNVIHTASRVYMKDGKAVANYKTNWKATLKSWYEDPELKNGHIRIRHIANKIYYIRYSKAGASFANRSMYLFRANRSLLKRLGAALVKGNVVSESR